jgi:hypothetical protein
LPEEHHALHTLVTGQSLQAIWDALNDHANEPQWRSDVQSVTSLGERDGKPVCEDYEDGNKVTLMTTESKPPTRMVRELTEAILPRRFQNRSERQLKPPSIF